MVLPQPSAHADIITGTKDDDDLYGTASRDVMRGLGSSDWMEGRRGNDAIHEGTGGGMISGGLGDDTVYAGPILATKDVWVDELYCGDGPDVVVYDRKTRDFKDNLHKCEEVKLVRGYEGF